MYSLSISFLKTALFLLALFLLEAPAQAQTQDNSDAFITTWNIQFDDDFVIIYNRPETAGSYTVDWGDGESTSHNCTANNPCNATHGYINAGAYRVVIEGDGFQNIRLSGAGLRKLATLEQWGDIRWTTMKDAFRDASNMTYQATDRPDLSRVTSLQNMFRGASIFNGDLSHWDVSNVTDMSNMFFNARAFNSDLSDWDVSNVTDMGFMFSGARIFNGDLSDWDVSAVRNMGSMFLDARAFNSDLSDWDVSSVASMAAMFSHARAFSGDLSDWDVSNVEDMNSMFNNAHVFNSELSEWDVSRVTDMNRMFFQAHVFNGDLSAWNVFQVTDMQSMFSFARAFNQNLAAWYIRLDSQTIAEGANVRVVGEISALNASLRNHHPWYAIARNSIDDDSNLFQITGGRVLKLKDTSPAPNLASQSSYTVTLTASGDDLFGSTPAVRQIRVQVTTAKQIQAQGAPILFGRLRVGRRLWVGTENITDTNGLDNVRYRYQWLRQDDDQGTNPISIDGATDMSYILTAADEGKYIAVRVTFNDDEGNEEILTSTAIGAIDPASSLVAVGADQVVYEGATVTLDSTTRGSFRGAPRLSYLWTHDAPPELGLTLTDPHAPSITFTAPSVTEDTHIVFTLSVGNADSLTTETDTLIVTIEGSAAAFITTWRLMEGDSITIPNTPTTTGNYTVDWGDGERTSYHCTANDPCNAMHGYPAAGVYRVVIEGDGFQNIRLNAADAPKLARLEQWGTIRWTTMESALRNASNMTYHATDRPDLSGVTSLGHMFDGALAFDGDLGDWDVSKVVDMSAMFAFAGAFNSDLNAWDVSQVTDMSSMFAFASAFNSNLNAWDVSSVTNTRRMFWNASAFAGDLSRWDISSVTNMSEMFRDAGTFNSDLSRWDVSGATDMRDMFRGATAFNQNLGAWYIQLINPTIIEGIGTQVGIISAQNAALRNQNPTYGTDEQAADDSHLFEVANGNTLQLKDSSPAPNLDLQTAYWVTLTASGSQLFGYTPATTQVRVQVIRQPPIPAQGVPTVVGHPRVGRTLLANTENITDTNGLDRVRYRYQWLRQDDAEGVNQVSIDGTTSVSYTLTAADEGKYIAVQVTFDDDEGYREVLTSTAIGAIDPADPLVAVGADQVVYAGATVTLDSMTRGSFRDAPRLSYVWTHDAPSELGLTLTDPHAPSITFTAPSVAEDTNIVFILSVSNADNTTTETDTLTVTVKDSAAAFITTWRVLDNNSITIPSTPTTSGSYQVDWGDGSQSDYHCSANTACHAEHSYTSAGVYRVVIEGDGFQNINLGSSDFAGRLASLEQWGTIRWTTMNGAFQGAFSMRYNANDVPDLSRVTDMSRMFFLAFDFNGNLSDWDVSNVTNMEGMFRLAATFDSDLSGWDVSHVTNMNSMFNSASNFNRNLSDWDVSSVTSMEEMFLNARSFNRDLSGWDVSHVTNMKAMFLDAVTFNSDLNDWDVSSVTTMADMFNGASRFNRDLNDWDVSSVTDMRFMFFNAPAFDGDLSRWDVSGVTSMEGMFTGARVFNGDLSNWDVSSVTNMEGMFWQASAFNGDLSRWDVSSVTSMRGMFFQAAAFNGGDLSRWDVSSVTNMSGIFNSAGSFNGDLSGWNVLNVTNMNSMFNSAGSFNGDLSDWDVSSVTDMSRMFNSAGNFNGDLSDWDVSSVTNMQQMFKNASAFNSPIGNWNISSVTNMDEMFSGATAFSQNLAPWYIQLDSLAIDEGANTRVGTLSAQNAILRDQNPSYAIVQSAPDQSNQFEIIDGNVLKLKDTVPAPSFLNRDSYTLTLSANGSNLLGTSPVTRQVIVRVTKQVPFPAEGVPTLNGYPRVGRRLWVGTENITDTNGLDNVRYRYQWLRQDDAQDTNPISIDGATDMSYILTAADEGKYIAVRVTFRDDKENEEMLTSTAIGAIDPASSLVEVGADRDAYEGATVTLDSTTRGSFRGAPRLSYLWTHTAPPELGLTITDPHAPSITFTAPSVTEDTHIVFILSAGNADSLTTETDTLIVTLEDSAAVFITTWNVGDNETLVIGNQPTTAGSYTVDWGDGERTPYHCTANEPCDAMHRYPTAGAYRIIIEGDGFQNIHLGSPEKLTTLEQWGDIRWTTMANAFNAASNLVYNADDTPDLSQVTSTRNMFRDARVFNGDLSHWDVSNVTDMSAMFQGADAFDQNLGAWYIQLNGPTSTEEVATRIGRLSAQNMVLRNQVTAYGVDTNASDDSALFEVTDGNRLRLKDAVHNFAHRSSYTLTLTANGDLFGNTLAKRQMTLPTAPITLDISSLGNEIVTSAVHMRGFVITGSALPESTVTVAMGHATLTTEVAVGAKNWQVTVPANADYFSEPLTAVTATATHLGHVPQTVSHRLRTDITPPSVTYTLPSMLTVGVGVEIEASEVSGDVPMTGAYAVADGVLPAGLMLDEDSGAIRGTPTTADSDEVLVTIGVRDAVGNSTRIALVIPAVERGVQTLTGFAYSSTQVTTLSAPPTVTVPTVSVAVGTPGVVRYSSSEDSVCTVDAMQGTLLLGGIVGECTITATAAETSNYLAASTRVTVTVVEAPVVELTLDAITGDDVVNGEEHEQGFAITGTVTAGSTVTVVVGDTALTTQVATGATEWQVNIPAQAHYIMGTELEVQATATRTSYRESVAVRRAVRLGLMPPSVRYVVPATLTVGVDVEIEASEVSGDVPMTGAYAVADGVLPAGLMLDEDSGAISGILTTAAGDEVLVTIGVRDAVGNSTRIAVVMPAVERGVQTLTGFAYSSTRVTTLSAPPTVTAPTVEVPVGTPGAVSYASSEDSVCSVDAMQGALMLEGLVGECTITATAAETSNYFAASTRVTVVVVEAPVVELTLDTITGDDVVNGEEHEQGFAITGTVTAGSTVTVVVGETALTTKVAVGAKNWQVTMPANADYLSEPLTAVIATATRLGHVPQTVSRRLRTDITPPTVTYTLPSMLTVGVDIEIEASEVSGDVPMTGAYAVADGVLPAGLMLDEDSGAISGIPTAAGDEVLVTIGVRDEVGNSTRIAVVMPAVERGVQTLTGFAYSSTRVTTLSAAPTVTAPTVSVAVGTPGVVSYASSEGSVCSVDAQQGTLLLEGIVGECTITASAAETSNYFTASTRVTVVVVEAPAVELTLDAITGDDVVNGAEHEQGFAITGTVTAGSTVTVVVGETALTTQVATGATVWQVNIPAQAHYIMGTELEVQATASRTSYRESVAVRRAVRLGLMPPSVRYVVPATLTVGVDVEIEASEVSGDVPMTGAYAVADGVLPAGLMLDEDSGAIRGIPTTAAGAEAAVTIAVRDEVGNSTRIALVMPAVERGVQTLTGFAYSSTRVTTLSAPPTVTAPTVEVPVGTPGALSYASSEDSVCSVDAMQGTLLLEGIVGECTITATAAETSNYFAASTRVTVVVVEAPVVELTLDAITGDDVVNGAEHEQGFAITGTVTAGSTVTVVVGETALTTQVATGATVWQVNIPAQAHYIMGTELEVQATATRTSYRESVAVRRAVRLGLMPPSVRYVVPATLTVGVDVEIEASEVSGDVPMTGAYAVADGVLPAGLMLDEDSGAIRGIPTTAAGNEVLVTIAVRDEVGNSTRIALVMPAVERGVQTLTGFAYSSTRVTTLSAPPTVTAPTVEVPVGTPGAVSYASSEDSVCSVDAQQGTLMLEGIVGECTITATAAETSNYFTASTRVTVVVVEAPVVELTLDAIAGDDVVNSAEHEQGFAITGTVTGGSTVTVRVGETALTTRVATGATEWQVNIPAQAHYIMGTELEVQATATRTGYRESVAVRRAVRLGLMPPSVRYVVPATLTVGVGVAIEAREVSGDVLMSGGYRLVAGDLPAGLMLDEDSGAIRGTPTTAAGAEAAVTIGVRDEVGNSTRIAVVMPAVERGVQTLTGFAYSSTRVTTLSAPPTVTAPTVEVPVGTPGAVSYASSEGSVCSVDAQQGTLLLEGIVGECTITASAAETSNYFTASTRVTVVVVEAPVVELTLDAITGDDVVNSAEHEQGFAITGTVTAGSTVTVRVGETALTTQVATGATVWQVNIPAQAHYIMGTELEVQATATRTSYRESVAVRRAVRLGLTPPSVRYVVPATLTVGVDVEIEASEVSGDVPMTGAYAVADGVLPAGLMLDEDSGAIRGIPTTAAGDEVLVTIGVRDEVGNSTRIAVVMPAVERGVQTLRGFAYSSTRVTTLSAPPTVTAPTVEVPVGTPGAVSYASSEDSVCTVDAMQGTLLLEGLVGECTITATAAETSNYLAASTRVTVVVVEAPVVELTLDAITGDDVVNGAEHEQGFAITGTVTAGSTVTVRVGETALTTQVGTGATVWQVNIPAQAHYIMGTELEVQATATRTSYRESVAVRRAVRLGLMPPSVRYVVPATLTVGVDVEIEASEVSGDVLMSGGYAVVGGVLPAGLMLDEDSGAISGIPTTAAGDEVLVTIGVRDEVGNSTRIALVIPAVERGVQTLRGFAYSSTRVTTLSAPPTVTVPTVSVAVGRPGVVSYASSEDSVCSVDAQQGTLLLEGIVGECTITATAAETSNYFTASTRVTVVVVEAPVVELTLDAITGDDVVNGEEHMTGFAITGTVTAGSTVTVVVGETALTTQVATGATEWQVNIPAQARYIMGTELEVQATASRTSYRESVAVRRAVRLGLMPPSVRYVVPATLTVGVGVEIEASEVSGDVPMTGAYAVADGVLPAGLILDEDSGAISGIPTTAAGDEVLVTIGVRDAVGNSTRIAVVMPAVERGVQTLTGFAYSSTRVTTLSAPPTVTAPTVSVAVGTPGAVSYASSEDSVCSVDAQQGTLLLEGIVGECTITARAAETSNYFTASTRVTVTVVEAPVVEITLDAITGDDVVNSAEHKQGFAITGTVTAGSTVTVVVGETALTTKVATGATEWQVNIPAQAHYIMGTELEVQATATRTGYRESVAVRRAVRLGLMPPSVRYVVPATLTVGVGVAIEVREVSGDVPMTGAYAVADGVLPAGLMLDEDSGAISGIPTTAAGDEVLVTIRVRDEVGNSTRIALVIPAVERGVQTLTGFAYSSTRVTTLSAAPTVTAPTVSVPVGTPGVVSYASSEGSVCTVDAQQGTLLLEGIVGECTITARAAETSNYFTASTRVTVTVVEAPVVEITLDAITGDDVVNSAEHKQGFAITGTVTAGSTVTVVVGETALTTKVATGATLWQVNIPAQAHYIMGTELEVQATATRTGYRESVAVRRAVRLGLMPPSVRYAVPATLTVGVDVEIEVREVSGDVPMTGAYAVVGGVLPAGLMLDEDSGAISGILTTAAGDEVLVTIGVRDAVGNSTRIAVVMPAVERGVQTLTGFAYSSTRVTTLSAAPTVTAPTVSVAVGTPGVVSYASSEDSVCTVDAMQGTLLLEGLVGECTITATAAETSNYLAASTRVTVVVVEHPPLTVLFAPSATTLRLTHEETSSQVRLIVVPPLQGSTLPEAIDITLNLRSSIDVLTVEPATLKLTLSQPSTTVEVIVSDPKAASFEGTITIENPEAFVSSGALSGRTVRVIAGRALPVGFEARQGIRLRIRVFLEGALQ